MALEVPAGSQFKPRLLERLDAHSTDIRPLSEQIHTNFDGTPTGVSLLWERLSPLLGKKELDERKKVFTEGQEVNNDTSTFNQIIVRVKKAKTSSGIPNLTEVVNELTNKPLYLFRYAQQDNNQYKLTESQLHAFSQGFKTIEKHLMNTAYNHPTIRLSLKTDFLVNHFTDDEKIEIATKLAPIITVATRRFQKRKDNELRGVPIDLRMIARIRSVIEEKNHTLLTIPGAI